MYLIQLELHADIAHVLERAASLPLPINTAVDLVRVVRVLVHAKSDVLGPQVAPIIAALIIEFVHDRECSLCKLMFAS